MMDVKDRVYAAGLSPPFTPEILEDSGRAAGVALLDIINKNPISRIITSTYKSVQNVREDLVRQFSNKIKVRRG